MALPPGWVDFVGNVPPVGTEGACRICHGVASGWATCFKCGQVWSAQPGFERIRLVVPCSVAVGGSAWYRALYTYKAGSFDQYAEVLASVLSTWLSNNGIRITTALGRQPDVITVVPSKRVDHPAPLWEVAHAVPGLRDRLRRSIRYRPGTVRPADRETVISDHFEVIDDVLGKAIVLVEDTWVSGQTPISAALALAEGGAESIVVLPIARMVYPDTLSTAYAEAVQPPYRAAWPN